MFDCFGLQAFSIWIFLFKQCNLYYLINMNVGQVNDQESSTISFCFLFFAQSKLFCFQIDIHMNCIALNGL